ncbi:MAG: pyruvate kinase [Lewinellaceae bacterium]|nr:pyruvate kinase [Lewinellaceae bacterium]
MLLHPASAVDLDVLIHQVQTVISVVEAEEQAQQEWLQAVLPKHNDSARNLVHYLALRAFDLSGIQAHLSSLGISSLAHSEAYTLANLYNVLHLLQLLQGAPGEAPNNQVAVPLGYWESKQQLQRNAQDTFGRAVRNINRCRVMVTMPSEAADDYGLIRALLREGMDLARINTSHDGPEVWQRIIENIRQAEKETGHPCQVYIDLSGPKLRTVLPSAEQLPAKRTKKKKGKKGLLVHRGDWLEATYDLNNPQRHWPLALTRIGVTLPDIFPDLKPGESIFFDDGKIGGKILQTRPDACLVEITQAAIGGSLLATEKGINLPDTVLTLASLTEADRECLPFIARYADVVGYSFVRRSVDVATLQSALRELGREDIGLVLKIETKEAFQNLSRLLLTAMRSPKVGVMIARGDLAVEVGFERNAEVQEEILWLCEAAHVPGIWATQVLETMAKKGLATRSEITDAAMAARAECVMLNKGPFIVEAVKTLEDIISRMERHQDKKRGSLHALSVARRFVKQPEERFKY